jgi:MoaA/NifB/PqqE/SkfB family radical SAM enzyme
LKMGLRRWWNLLDSRLAKRISGLSDEAFTKKLFQEMLGRPAEEQARTDAMSALREGRLTRGQLRQILAQSQEHQAYRLTQSLYHETLGRDPTPEERWLGIQMLCESKMDPGPLQAAIRDTMEFLFLTGTPPPDEEPYRAVRPPQEVWLEVTTRCNMMPPCIMCGRSAFPEDTPWHDMAPETWQRLLPVLRQARTVGLHGGGEPLIYPYLFPLLEEIDTTRTEIGFNTSGHLLTTDNSRRLIEHQVSWISVSLDAATPEMYYRLRRSDRFERVTDRIRRLRAMRDEQGSSRPSIEVNMTVMCANLAEVPQFIELAADLQADKVMFQQIKPGGDWVIEAPDGYLFDYRKEELANCADEHAQRIEQAWQRALELGIPLQYEIVYRATGAAWPEERTRTPEYYPLQNEITPQTAPQIEVPTEAMCEDPWTNLLVYVDGDATFCCYHYPKSILGNTRGEPFEDIWNGPRARTIRKLVLEEAAPKCCRACFRTC